jgi:hypothetical protein
MEKITPENTFNRTCEQCGSKLATQIIRVGVFRWDYCDDCATSKHGKGLEYLRKVVGA